MAEDFYNMGGDEGTSAGKGADAHADGEENEEQMEGEEALLPKSILAGKEFKVGDEVVLEITSIKDDEITVKYAKEKPGGDGEEGEHETEMDRAGGRMAGMTNGSMRGGGGGMGGY